MDITSSRKHVIYDNLIHFMALADMLSSEDISEIITSLRDAHYEDETRALEFIAACEKYAKGG